MVHGQGWIQSSSSDFQKSLKCFQTCICYFSGSLMYSRNQLSFLFYCFFKVMKWNKEESASVPPQQVRWVVSVRTLSFLIDTFKNNAKKFVGSTGENFYTGGGTQLRLKITQNPLRLARNTHIVLRTTQTRLWLAIWAANYRRNYWQSYIKGTLSPRVPSCSCSD